jgi:hypothetical protein
MLEDFWWMEIKLFFISKFLCEKENLYCPDVGIQKKIFIAS